MVEQITVEWIDGHREPQCTPDPNFPHGKDLDISNGATPTCETALPCPAKRCGHYVVRCSVCGMSVVVTTAGRPDDPKSIKIACKTKGTA